MKRHEFANPMSKTLAVLLCLLYLLLAALWYRYADQLFVAWISDAEDQARWEVIKVALPVVAAAVLWYQVMRAGRTRAPAEGKTKANGDRKAIILTIAFSVLCALAIAATIVFERINARRTVMSEKAKNAEILVQVLKEQTADSFNAVDIALQSTIKAMAVQPMSSWIDTKDVVDQLLQDHIRNLPFIRAIWILDADGNMIHDSQKLPGLYNLSDREYFQIHRSRTDYGLFIDRPILSKLGVPFVALSHRLNKPDGSFNGVIVAALEPKYLRNFYHSIRQGKDGAIALVRGDGVLMLRVPAAEGLEGKKLDPLPSATLLPPQKQQGSFEFKSSVDGIERTYFFARVPGRPLVVSVGLGNDEMLADWRSTSRMYIVASLAFLLLIGWLCSLVLRELNRRNELHQALRESDAALKAAQRLSGIGSWRRDMQTGTGEWSDEMFRVLGLPPAEVPPLETFLHMIHPEDRPQIENVVRQGIAWSGELRSNPADGPVRYFHARSAAERDRSGRVVALIGTMQDMTEQRAADAKLLLAARVFEHTKDGIMVADADNRIVGVNAAFERITGYTEAEVLGENPRLLHSDLHDEAFYKGLADSLESSGHWRGELWSRRKNGEVFPEWLIISSISDQQGRNSGYVGVFTDLSEIKEANDQVEFLINHDPLTRLPNRSLLKDRLQQAIKAAASAHRQVALLLLNIDRLQRVNDSIGHDAGDTVLREMAQRLLDRLAPGDTLARLGSDEFALVLTRFDDPDDINAKAYQMLETISVPWVLAGHELSMTASIGIAVYPADGRVPDDLIKNADTALSHVKHAGRNGFRFFAAEMNTHAIRWLSLEHQLRGALARDEFVLHYQPKVCIADMRICGVEALIRWDNTALGRIPPGDFIPLAEDTGLIGKIGEWAIRTACMQNKAWQEAGLPIVSIAVNVSAHQITSGNLPAIVRAALEEAGLAPCYLEIELTESVLMREAELAMAQIAELRGMGVAVSLDDFGTGFSSLSYLSRFALDKLKIDQSFVHKITSDPKSAAIAQATIALAHGLGMIVVAEGVENEEQLDYLRRTGCDELQGFYISAPLPAGNLAGLLK